MARVKLDLEISGSKYSNILFMSASLSQITFFMRLGTWLLAASCSCPYSSANRYKRAAVAKKASEKDSEWSNLRPMLTPWHMAVRGWQLPIRGRAILPNIWGYHSHDSWEKSLWPGQPPQFKSTKVINISWASLYRTHVTYFHACCFTITLWGEYHYSHFTGE